MSNLTQHIDGGAGFQGIESVEGFIPVSIEWLASSVSKTSFVAGRTYIVRDITARVEVAGTDASAVTATIVKVPSGTAVASGTALHSGTINLKGTAATKQALTLSTTAANLKLSAGDAIGIKFAGTLTAATGCVSVTLAPA